MLPNYLPDEDVLKKRREPKYVVDPKDVKKNDTIRVREWALNIMKKNSSRLKDTVKNLHIVYEKEVKPEEIDIRNIYPFKDLYYTIYKHDPHWCLRLLYKTEGQNTAILAEFKYINIDGI